VDYADLDADVRIKVTVQKRQDPDYGGYMLALKNRADEIVFTKSSKTLWQPSAKNIINAKLRHGYDREFKYDKALRATYGLSGSVS